MDKYTASNGIEVEREGWRMNIACEGGDYPEGHHLSAGETDALREFFQAERDEELGRWRYPENPDYVVYPAADDADLITVMRESVARIRKMRREGFGLTDYAEQFVACAEAYFEAHPERKPWEDAKEGDVWLLTINGEEEALLFRHDRTFISRDGDEFAPEEAYITAGRRIYPEAGEQ